MTECTPTTSNAGDGEYRKLLEQCETDAASAFDKTTITISAGALAVSLAFLKDIVPRPVSWSIYSLLAPAWLALVVSLLAVLLSLMASMKSMRYQIECLDGRRTKPDREPSGGPWRRWTERFNHAALVGCVAGVALLATFVFVNTWSKAMADSVKTPPVTTTHVVAPNTAGRVTPDRPVQRPPQPQPSGKK
jgi:hypothetical protein